MSFYLYKNLAGETKSYIVFVKKEDKDLQTYLKTLNAKWNYKAGGWIVSLKHVEALKKKFVMGEETKSMDIDDELYNFIKTLSLDKKEEILKKYKEKEDN